MPDDWALDAERCARAGVPDAEVMPCSKGEIALAELDRVRAAGVRFATVLADAGYGASAVFRHGLDARGLQWAVGIPRNQKMYGLDVQLVKPAGRARKLVPDEEPREAEAVLAELPWRRVTWRSGTKGKLVAKFAAVRVRVGDGPIWGNNKHLPGKEAWLVGEVSQGSCRAKLDGMADAGEWRSSGERKYYLSNLAPGTSTRALAAAIKARWVCEQGHQQLKQELGLGHFEGRSWTGLHRHALMTCIAFAYLQHLRLAKHRRTRRGKNVDSPTRATPVTKPARLAPRHYRQAFRSPHAARSLPRLQTAVPIAI